MLQTFGTRVDEFGDYHSPNIAFATNVSAQFSGDYTPYLDKKILPIAQKRLAAYQFAEKKKLDEGNGNTWMATRVQRVPLPYSPLSEATPPTGETLSIQQVQCVAQQWGDTVVVSDIARITPKHDMFQQAVRMVGVQEAETYERNIMNMLMGTAQVNYVNSRGSRANLAAGDVLDPNTVLRTVAALETLGAYEFDGPPGENPKVSIGGGSGKAADKSPESAPHFCALIHTLLKADWSQNATVILSRSYNAANRLYNFEFGEWGGCRFVATNMVPTFTGLANTGYTLTAVGNGGSLATGTYTLQVTGQDTQNQYESQIYQTNTVAVVSGGPGNTGSITVALPSTAGYTYSVYLSAAGGTTLANLGATNSSLAPTVGPLVGQATQIPAGSTITITAAGVAQSPPAAPATGLTVYPCFIFGKGAYAVVTLQNAQHFMLTKADKSDPLNQKALVGWKMMQGYCILNQQYLARVECVSAYSPNFG